MKLAHDEFVRLCREGRAAGKSWRQIAKDSGLCRRTFDRRAKRLRELGELDEPMQPAMAINGRSTLSRIDPETGAKTPILISLRTARY